MLRLVVADDSGEPVRTRAPRGSVAPDDEHTAVIESAGQRAAPQQRRRHRRDRPRVRSPSPGHGCGPGWTTTSRAFASCATSRWPRTAGTSSDGPRASSTAGLASPSRAMAHPEQPDTDTPERDFLDESAALAESEERATEEQVRRERRSNRRLRAGPRRGRRPARGRHRHRRSGQDVRGPCRPAVRSGRRPPARGRGVAQLPITISPCSSPWRGPPSTTPPTLGTTSSAVLDRAPELIGVRQGSRVHHRGGGTPRRPRRCHRRAGTPG